MADIRSAVIPIDFETRLHHAFYLDRHGCEHPCGIIAVAISGSATDSHVAVYDLDGQRLDVPLVDVLCLSEPLMRQRSGGQE